MEWAVVCFKTIEYRGRRACPTRRKYSLIQPAIPLGIGFKFALNDKWSVGIEYGIRITFTDHIDDVSKTYFDPTLLSQESRLLSAVVRRENRTRRGNPFPCQHPFSLALGDGRPRSGSARSAGY